jgi:hypothetical protein
MEKKDKYEGGFVVRAICELLGAPKEHIDATMKTLVEKAKSLPDAKVLKEKVFEAKEHDNGLFSSFVELEISFKKFNGLMDFCFNFMPSSIEIVEPEKFSIDAQTINAWINELQGRLHQVDKVAKESTLYRTAINKQIAALVRTNILTHLMHGPLEPKSLSDYVGINEASIKPFIDMLVKNKQIKLEGEKYTLAKKVKFDDNKTCS